VIREFSDGKTYAIAKSVEHPDCPPVKKVVRGNLFFGAYVFEPMADNDVRVTYLINADIGGSIPKRAINLVNKKQPMVLSNIKKILCPNS
jgi:hypothetical protein